MEGGPKEAPVHTDEGLALEALRCHLGRVERQLGDLAWQLMDLAAMGASPLERRGELARLRAWAREAADEFKTHIATPKEEERPKVVETAIAAEASREDAAPQSDTGIRAAATVTAPEEAAAEAAVPADTLAESAEPVEALHNEPATAAEASRDDAAPQSETGNCAAATATAPEAVAEAAVPADTSAESADPVDAPHNEPATAVKDSGEFVVQQGDTAASETAPEAVAQAATSAETPIELAEPVESLRNQPGDPARLEHVETAGSAEDIASVDRVTEAAGLATSTAGAEAAEPQAAEAGAEAAEAAAEAAEVAAVAEAAAAAEVAGIVRSTDGEEASESLQLPRAANATHTDEVASVVEAAQTPARSPAAAPLAAERLAAVEAAEEAAEAASAGAAEQGLDSEEEDSGSDPEQQLWDVVGGANAGGILVRDGVAFSSQQENERLQMGAVVRELQLDGDRLQYELLSGMGPRTGWVSVKVKERELLRRRDPSRNADIEGPQARLILWPRGQRRRKLKGLHTQFTKVCVMGPFNSGTNALMREIPRFFDAKVINKHRADNPAWWKHGIQKGLRRAPEDVFFVCLVRDPGYWIQSLARDPADGTFNEFEPVRCVVDKTGTAMYEQQDHTDPRQLFNHILFDGKVHPNALCVWEKTVQSYFDEQALPTSQMAVLRYEDYVFRFEEAMKALAQRGLALKQNPPPFVALSDTAKDHTHPKAARRDLGTTKRDLTNPSKRYAGRTADQKAKLENMDANLISLLGYGKDAVAKWKD